MPKPSNTQNDGIIKIGLTGSIGMGKSTTAQMFKEAGAAVFCADDAVHELYAKGGAAVPILRAVFPDVIVDGAIDRAKLSKHLQADPLHIEVLESFIHPLVAEARAKAIQAAIAAGKKVIVFDVPLLFETGGDKHMDKTVVVTADYEVKRKRVLARPGMSQDKLDFILSRQMPDAEKRKRADYVIRTDKGLDHARDEVERVLNSIVQTP